MKRHLHLEKHAMKIGHIADAHGLRYCDIMHDWKQWEELQTALGMLVGRARHRQQLFNTRPNKKAPDLTPEP